MFEYSPIKKKFKSTVGGIKADSLLRLNVSGDAQSATLVLTKEGEGHVPVSYPMQRSEEGFTVEVRITTCGLYFYHFIIDGERFGSDEMLDLTHNGGDYMQLVYEGDFKPLKGGVIYQIMPDRFNIGGEAHITKGVFCKDRFATPTYLPDENGVYNNEFFGGNLKGITAKLDYLLSLGVTYIYLNPIFESPSSHRYDTGDYEKIDEALGTEADLSELISEAEKRNIGIILDGVFSHTGADSKYFNRYGNYDSVGAYQAKDSPYYSWYSFIRYPDVYRSWWGFDTLPEVNETAPSYMEYMLGENGVVNKWESKGIAGWRLDVADELPDEFLYALGKRSKVTLIGEVWENAARKYAYGNRRRYLLGGQLDGVTNYPIRRAVIDYVMSGNNSALRKTVRELINDYPQKAFLSMMNVLGTHDTERILTALSCDKTPQSKAQKANYVQSDIPSAVKRLKIASLIQFFLPGVPCVYYGDEAGLYGHEDPFCRKCYPWGEENEELVNHYALLGKIREKYSSVFAGEAEDVSPNENIFAFKRSDGHTSLTLYVNMENMADFPRNTDFSDYDKILQFDRACIFIKRLG